MHRLFSQPGLTLAHRIAPYRIGTEFLHDYYTVNTSLLKPYLRETFIQSDPDDDTEKFLEYSVSMKSKFKYKFILPKLLSDMEHDYDSLHKWRLSDSYLMSPNQFQNILKQSNVPYISNSRIFGLGQGSGTVLYNLGVALNTKNLYCYDDNSKANSIAGQKGIEICTVERKPRHLQFMKETRKFDIVLLCNILDRSIKPLQILDFCKKILKPNGVVIISLSAPWRPAAKKRFTGFNHAYVIEEAKYDQKNYVCQENLIPVMPENREQKYIWHTPQAIPQNFEAAAAEILGSIEQGGHRDFFMRKKLDKMFRKEIVIESVRSQPNRLLGWTRTPYWIVGSPIDYASDNITIVTKLGDSGTFFEGFDEDDDDDDYY